jgi:hypothetical protein
MSQLLTLKEVAAELRVSQQWLKYWLVDNPVDTAGVPLYVPMGRRLKFERQDVDRIIAHLRDLESARLGLSGQSKARLAGLLSKIEGGITYEERLRMREANKRRPSNDHTGAKLLGDLAANAVLGPSRLKQRRARLPRSPRPKSPPKADGS